MTKTSRADLFARRLRELCDQRASHAQVARDLGINRQQLSRYLSGGTVPRDGLLSAIANYFSVPVSHFFSEQAEISTGGLFSTSLALLLTAAITDPIRPEDLEPGFYRQYKHSFTMPSRIFVALVQVKEVDGVFRYRRRTSATYAKTIAISNTRNTFDGFFFKQGSNLALIDVGSLIGDITFHVMATRLHYNTQIKHGHHINVPGFTSRNANKSRFVLQKMAPEESVLRFARQQGFVELDSLPIEIRPFFSGEFDIA